MKLKLLTLALSASALTAQPAKKCCCKKNSEQEEVTIPKMPEYEQQVKVEVLPSETDYNGYEDYNEQQARSDQYQPAAREDYDSEYQDASQEENQQQEINLSVGAGNCHTCTEADKP